MQTKIKRCFCTQVFCDDNDDDVVVVVVFVIEIKQK